ncbi:hypothetical protein LINGRAHAP2_LOCUS25181 [Linum grandiflorum]
MKNILGGLSAIRNGLRGFQLNLDDGSILSYGTSVLCERIGDYMEIDSPCTEVSEEAARESLISISYSVPDTAGNTDVKSATLSYSTDDAAAGVNNSGIEKYMSELISISDTRPLDYPADSGTHETWK